MDVIVKILNLDFVSPNHHNNRCNLHCTLQTASDKFTKSSLLSLADQRPADTQWPTFTYRFQKQYLQMSVSFRATLVVSAENSADQQEIGTGFSPLVINPKIAKTFKETVLNRKICDIPLFVNIGKVIYEISHSLDPLPEGERGPEKGSKYWLGLATTRQNLPLLKDLELVNTFSEVEETEVYLKMKEEEQSLSSASNGPLIPGNFETLTVIFHIFASSWNTDKFQPVTCLVKGDRQQAARVNESLASAEWFWNEIEEPGSLNAGNILKAVNLKIQSPSHQMTSLYLFEEDIAGPIFHANEPLQGLVPFRFYHRGWLQNIPQPTVPSDLLIHNSIHVLTSIHITPSQTDYELYEGFEIPIKDITLGDDHSSTSNKTIILGAQIVRSSNLDQYPALSKKGFTPSFLETSENKKTGSDNFKLSFRSPAITLPDQLKDYFFFPENEGIIREDIEDNDFPVLVLHICVIDQASSVPWWYDCHHYQCPLSIDSSVFNILMGDDEGGVRWDHSWQEVSSGEIQKCSLEIVLKWKDKDSPFVSQSSYEDMASLPNLNELVSLEHIDQDYQGPLSGHPTQSRVTFNFIETPPTPVYQRQEPVIGEEAYLKTIQRLEKNVVKLNSENERLHYEKAHLSNEIDRLKIVPIEERDSFDSSQEARIVALERELKIERLEVNAYRLKVQSLQNQLIHKNDSQASHCDQKQAVLRLKGKVEKYRKCYDTAVQQESILVQLEMLITTLLNQLPNESTNDTSKNESTTNTKQQDPVDNEEDEIINQPFVPTLYTDSSIAVIAETHIQQNLKTMDSEIIRLRRENELLHSHLSSMILTIQSRAKTSNNNKTHHKPIDNEARNGSRNKPLDTSESVISEEPLTSF